LENETESFSDKAKELVPFFIMAAFVLIVQVGSLWLSATEYMASQPPLDNPENVGYAIYYIIGLLIVSALLIFLLRRKKKVIRLAIRLAIYISIGMTLFYFFVAVLDKAVGDSTYTVILSILFALALTVLIHKYPEWYIIDITGLMIAIGICTLLGISLSYMPIIILMVGLLIYDFIAVYKTKHMITLAHGMMDLKLPILFVIPKKWNYSFIKDDFSEETEQADEKSEEKDKTDLALESAEGEEQKKKSDALFMGLGDAVIPTLLVISSNHFLEHDGVIAIPSLYAMIGTWVGFAALMYLVSKGKPQAGLPFLNTGAIVGFVIGVIVSGTAISISLL
jgi:Uncharacterized protein conserved in archaea